ncbi:MAG TPA: HD domain-containing protein, partial [Nitrococcus sp.]|nr:HD domain-containing protein [Nitrococcus sp.]
MVNISGERQASLSIEIPFEDWVARLSRDLSQEERDRLRLAWNRAQAAYSGRCGESGESYFQHALAVTALLATLNLGTDAIIAGLLHSLPRVEAFEPELLAAELGEAVPNLIDGAMRVGTIGELHEP